MSESHVFDQYVGSTYGPIPLIDHPSGIGPYVNPTYCSDTWDSHMDQSHSFNGREMASTTLAAKNASKIHPKLAACVGFAARAAKKKHSFSCGNERWIREKLRYSTLNPCWPESKKEWKSGSFQKLKYKFPNNSDIFYPILMKFGTLPSLDWSPLLAKFGQIRSTRTPPAGAVRLFARLK